MAHNENGNLKDHPVISREEWLAARKMATTASHITYGS